MKWLTTKLQLKSTINAQIAKRVRDDDWQLSNLAYLCLCVPFVGGQENLKAATLASAIQSSLL